MPSSVDEHELRTWIRLSLEPGLGAARIRQLLSVFGMPQEIFSASTNNLARYLEPAVATRLRLAAEPAIQAAIDRALAWLQQSESHHLITLSDPQYPTSLFQLADPPLLLYAHGQLACLGRPMLAIVGARHATHEGTENAQAFADYLAQQGWCIVSGLASGIDGAAHAGALLAGQAGGSTVAVLGTGIDRIYPAAHRSLAHQISSLGLMLSEFTPGTRALPYHFPQRNRIVAALSQGVLVVEAAARSGSLITARLAGELGREVFAIPGSIHSPLSRGCHALIRQGAKLVESGQDILEELQQGQWPGGQTEQAKHPQLAADPSKATRPPGKKAHTPALPACADIRILLRALGHTPTSADTLLERTGWPVGHLMSQLSLLEIAGCLNRQPDGSYRRVSRRKLRPEPT